MSRRGGWGCERPCDHLVPWSALRDRAGGRLLGIWMRGRPGLSPRSGGPTPRRAGRGAWTRFSAIEVPGTIVPVTGTHNRKGVPNLVRQSPQAWSPLGVVCGIIGLFPDYVAGSSLAHQPSEVVAHAAYLAAWTASAVLIVRGGPVYGSGRSSGWAPAS